jgi:acyl carrier protein
MMKQKADVKMIRDEISNFISTNILAKGVQVNNDTILNTIGVDSFSVIEIILFIERKFGVIIPDESLVPENLKTVEAIANCTFYYLQKH